MTRLCVECGCDIDTRPGLAWRIVYDTTVGWGCSTCITEPLSLLNVFNARAGQTYNPDTWSAVEWVVVPKRSITFQVYHAKNITNDKGRVIGIKGEFGMTRTVFPDDYTLVAEVHTTALRNVFDLTNHITHPWPENEEVGMRTTDRVRSTSVQDIIRRDQYLYVVAPYGYRNFIYDDEPRPIPAMYSKED